MIETILLFCATATSDICREVLVTTDTSCRSEVVISMPEAVQKGPAECREPTDGLPVRIVAEGVFVFSGDVADATPENRGAISNAGFIVGAESVAVVDALGSRAAAEDLLRSIRKVTDKPISHLILTHMHPDHVLGASVFADVGAQIVGHYRLPRALADREASYMEAMNRLIGAEEFLGSYLIAPDVLVEDRLQIDLGGRVLTLVAHPNAHTGTDVTVFDEQTETLFAGDLIFHRHIPALDGSLLGWQAVLQDLDAQRIVPGHGAAFLPWPEGGKDTARYLDVIARETRAAIQEGKSMSRTIGTIGQGEREMWDLFDEFNNRNSTVAFSELEWE